MFFSLFCFHLFMSPSQSPSPVSLLHSICSLIQYFSFLPLCQSPWAPHSLPSIVEIQISTFYGASVQFGGSNKTFSSFITSRTHYKILLKCTTSLECTYKWFLETTGVNALTLDALVETWLETVLPEGKTPILYLLPMEGSLKNKFKKCTKMAEKL